MILPRCPRYLVCWIRLNVIGRDISPVSSIPRQATRAMDQIRDFLASASDESSIPLDPVSAPARHRIRLLQVRYDSEGLRAREVLDYYSISTSDISLTE